MLSMLFVSRNAEGGAFRTDVSRLGRTGDADAAIVCPKGRRRGLGKHVVSLPSSPSGVLMQSSDREDSESSPNLVGLGEGHQPVGPLTTGSRVLPCNPIHTGSYPQCRASVNGHRFKSRWPDSAGREERSRPGPRVGRPRREQ